MRIRNFLKKQQSRKMVMAFVAGTVAAVTMPRDNSAFFSVYVLPAMVTGVAIGITVMLLLDFIKNSKSNIPAQKASSPSEVV